MNLSHGVNMKKKAVFSITKVTTETSHPAQISEIIEEPKSAPTFSQKRIVSEKPEENFLKLKKYKTDPTLDKFCNLSPENTELSLLMHHCLSQGNWVQIASYMSKNPSQMQILYFQIIDTSAGILSIGDLDTTYISPLLFIKLLYSYIVIYDVLVSDKNNESFPSSNSDDIYILSVIKRSKLTEERCEKSFSAIKSLFITIMYKSPKLTDLNKCSTITDYKSLFANMAEYYQQVCRSDKVVPISFLITTILEKGLNACIPEFSLSENTPSKQKVHSAERVVSPTIKCEDEKITLERKNSENSQSSKNSIVPDACVKKKSHSDLVVGRSIFFHPPPISELATKTGSNLNLKENPKSKTSDFTKVIQSLQWKP